MGKCGKLITVLGFAALFCCSVSPFSGIAMGVQTAPVVTPLAAMKDGTVTPTRVALNPYEANATRKGYIHVSDPHSGGVLVLDKAGKLVKTIQLPQEAEGLAFSPSGDLLVTQGTYVVVLRPDVNYNFTEFTRLNGFKSAFSIAVDNRISGGTNRIYVSDIQDFCVQIFDGSTYLPFTTSITVHKSGRPTNSFGTSVADHSGVSGPGYFNRPAGIAFEKTLGLVAVADSLSGSIQFFNPDGTTISFNTLGTFGAYDPSLVQFTYPQAISFEYDAVGVLARAYILDTNQNYVMVLDASTGVPSTWTTRFPDIGGYGNANGNLISASDLLVDSTDPDNNRLLVTNGFGSLSVFGLGSIQPYNVNITNVGSSSLTLNWTNSSATSLFNKIRVYQSTSAGVLGTEVGGAVTGDLPNTAITLGVTGLTPYTTYYYTVRAVDNVGTETSNINQISAKTASSFDLTVNIVGSGQVNGDYGVTCSSGTCKSPNYPLIPSDTLVTLIASPSGGSSVFDGWTGACTTTSATCQVTMDASKGVTATFITKMAYRVAGAYFDNLQDAYREAMDGAVIQVLSGTWPSTTSPTEYMTAWQAKNVTIEGGYDATFTSNVGGSSTISGRTNLSAGKIVMKQVKIRP